jgi:serine/threonine protein kinase
MHQELPDELASRQRFEREAKLMALLEHPNCVSVIDYGVHDEKPFLVMDLVRGTSLIDLMEKTGPLEIGKSADVIRQVLSGLAHAHELGIVHRDIKPANIMLTEKAGLGMQVRILDFGLARMSETSTKLTTGIVVGTPNYMAPEQCKGSDIDARTDIYACGVMLFEMLTGRKPFVADDPIAVVRKHLLEKPPTLASIEPRIEFGELEAVVAKALAKAPADRYASAGDMSKAVESAAAKVSKTSAAALFARAVPENPDAPANSPQATMSGWSVPQDARSIAIPSSQVPAPIDSASPSPSGIPSPGSGPTGGVASVSNASGPFTGVAKVEPSGPAFTSGASVPGGWGSAPGGSPSPSSVAGSPASPSSVADSPASSAASPAGGKPPVPAAAAKPGALPPLPQAKPYQAPAARPGYVPGAASAAAASAVAAAQAATAGAPTTTMESLASSNEAPPVPASGAPPVPSGGAPASTSSSAPSASSDAPSSGAPVGGHVASNESGGGPVPSIGADPRGEHARPPSAPLGDLASGPVPTAAVDGISTGTPDAALDVPPTRPSMLPPTAPLGGSSSGDRPIPQLPFSKKQLMIAGGGLFVLIILIAVFAGGGSDKKAPKDTKGSGSSAVIDMETPPGDNVASTIESAKSLIAAEDYEQAAAILKDARKANPNNAEVAFLAGKAYFGKLWWADGIESFRAAIKLEPSYKDDADLLKTVLKGFLTTPDVDDRIVGFMRRDIGPPMRPYLEETAEKHPKKALRARASAELNAGK